MPRMLITIVAGLAAGIAQAGPGHAQDGKEHAAPPSEQMTLAELYADQEKPELWIGTKAPALQLAHFPRGEAITSFEPGQTYVVEMWATWCGPCIAAFPHLAELQKKYAGDLNVIGVNIWERAEGDERIELVEDFVAEHTEMQYTVAIEEGTAMADSWMKPAGRNGIPSAFIVDGTGRVAWMGHPMTMDEPLEQIINGNFDTEAAADKVWNEQLASIAFSDIRAAGAEGNHGRIAEIAGVLIGTLSEDASGLSQTSMSLLGVEGAPEGNVRLAHKAALKAAELTEWEDWIALYAYAWASHAMGDHAEAVKWQEKVVELTTERNKAFMAERLDLYRGEG
ncbi:MAG: TlpA disulfide reductase family protein [Planctomycetota bacterium]